MSSQSTSDGSYSLTVTFELGTNLDLANVMVQNRVNLALPQLPDVVKATGIVTKKRSPDILLVAALSSPDQRFSKLYISNYGFSKIRDELSRIPGVSEVLLFGQRDYSMRIWLNPKVMAVRKITAGDVVKALAQQNVQVAAGQIGQPPTTGNAATQLVLDIKGRLDENEEYENVVAKPDSQGR